MKTLFIGGMKSGKSRLAEAYTLEQAKTVKPYYLATAELVDDEINARINAHRERRGDLFILIEEPLALVGALQDCPGPVLVDCVTLWLNNMLYRNRADQIFPVLDKLMQLPIDIVLVQNEVGMGIIPDNPLARTFVDLSGRVAQHIAEKCDRVLFCCAGLTTVLK